MKTILRHLRAWMGGADRALTYEYAQERVRRGAAYLDDADPGWHARLDLGGLALESGSACVLGQLHGSFRSGLSRAQLVHLGSAPRASVSPVRYGFQCVQGVSDEEAERDFRHLNRAWREAVRHRQTGNQAGSGSSGRHRAPNEEPRPAAARSSAAAAGSAAALRTSAL